MFLAVDGKPFFNEKDCQAHCLDCIGEEIDGLLTEAISVTDGSITRSMQHKMALHILENRVKLLPALIKLAQYIEELEFPESEECDYD